MQAGIMLALLCAQTALPFAQIILDRDQLKKSAAVEVPSVRNKLWAQRQHEQGDVAS